jgi:hypothetical protein
MGKIEHLTPMQVFPMSIKSLVVSVVIGLGSLSLSGCVYDSGSFYDSYGPYHARGYYSRGAIVYDSGNRVRPRYPGYSRRYVSDRYVRRIYRPSEGRYVYAREPGRPAHVRRVRGPDGAIWRIPPGP